jgi:hypothetical protein
MMCLVAHYDAEVHYRATIQVNIQKSKGWNNVDNQPLPLLMKNRDVIVL